ncbi:hypothetical protein L1987_81133 [Smallanthus sonchifolius]|uniref:Uncharacterized protein n=1 Tax=Smallanthus sonchifolius TaxID=185202 RepID=A0ACB8YPL3_9ASTR|nr:hypothetical protein L1987_81133 [Smallanthus sonchifolius]
MKEIVWWFRPLAIDRGSSLVDKSTKVPLSVIFNTHTHTPSPSPPLRSNELFKFQKLHISDSGRHFSVEFSYRSSQLQCKKR